MKNRLAIFLVAVALVAITSFALWLVCEIFNQFKQLDSRISVALLTAATTVIVATLTVVLGKYYERLKDIEAHYRTKKTEIYDEFLKEFFRLFHSSEESMPDAEQDEKLVSFLREWQRKMILWGGQGVLAKYVEWMGHLKKGEPNAQSLFMTEDFFREIRKDLGHKNNKLPKGTFIRLLLRDPELFLVMAKDNPNITITQLSEIEKKIHNQPS